ncbi:thiamine pyrophosphokinase [Acetobacteraceae bacterium KSS8]|uniref:Thiamine pyrophosphokinase n=1 Tax=Endosaccharibacter trunci TaxID=2812733 RepID=A0ABT1W7C4_9PROT|nr:thiamine pyrophosphokinase [Acetobacteraceae bacterium KSS8]
MDIAPFLRHLERCNNTTLPGGRLPFRLGAAPVGFVAPALAPELESRGVRREGDALVLDDPSALAALGRSLTEAKLFRFRDEPFDIRAVPDGPVLARLDRGVLPGFGVLAEGLHLNGLVQRTDGLHLWVGHRAENKLLDPGKLDHLAAGGIAAGHDPLSTLEKEGAEECGLPPELARQAIPAGIISYVMQRPEGLRRDRLHCFDVMLPESFQPHAHDGEMTGFTLMTLEEAFRLVRDTDRFKFNVNLVLIDLLLRHGLIDPSSADGALLKERLAGPYRGGPVSPVAG